jgi:hypothetical protein
MPPEVGINFRCMTLKSFFWVLIGEGPGGVRREELEQKNQAKKEYTESYTASSTPRTIGKLK